MNVIRIRQILLFPLALSVADSACARTSAPFQSGQNIGQRVLAAWFHPLTGETRQLKPMVAVPFLTVLSQPDWKLFAILNVEVLP